MTSAITPCLIVISPTCAASVDNVVLLMTRVCKSGFDCNSRYASAYNSLLFNQRLLRDRNLYALFWIPLACVTRAFDSTCLGVKRIEYPALDGNSLQRTLHSMSSNKRLLLPQLREFGNLGRSVIPIFQETTFYGVKSPRS